MTLDDWIRQAMRDAALTRRFPADRDVLDQMRKKEDAQDE